MQSGVFSNLEFLRIIITPDRKLAALHSLLQWIYDMSPNFLIGEAEPGVNLCKWPKTIVLTPLYQQETEWWAEKILLSTSLVKNENEKCWQILEARIFSMTLMDIGFISNATTFWLSHESSVDLS